MLINKKSSYEALTTAAREDGTDRPHEELSTEIIVTEPGYVYIYLSNDSPVPKEVYFDQFNVEHAHSAIVQSDDYYPFGLSFNFYKRENSVVNKYLYNGKERQDDLGLGWDDYGARMYDPAIGRWGTVDPLADHPNQVGMSPYNAFWNNPIKYNDPDGKCPECPDEVYVPLADHVYDATEGSSINGWTVVEGGIYENAETGFRGALYQGSGEWEGQYIFATAGTDPISPADWKNNKDQILGSSEQYSASVGLAKNLSSNYEGVSFTGHSLGGGLASANALAVEGKAVTFNAAGLSGSTKSSLGLSGNTANISAYVVQGETVSYYQGAMGLRAEGNLKALPASYMPYIPGTPVDDFIRIGQRVNNHFMGVVTSKFNETMPK